MKNAVLDRNLKPVFKREKTRLADGDYHTTSGVTLFLNEQEVAIIKVNNEDEDLWTVQTARGDRLVVDGYNLSPHPDEPELNTEFFERLLTWPASGPLMHGFLIEAIDHYAKQILAMTPEEVEEFNKGFIGYHGWSECAREVQHEVAARYSKLGS